MLVVKKRRSNVMTRKMRKFLAIMLVMAMGMAYTTNNMLIISTAVTTVESVFGTSKSPAEGISSVSYSYTEGILSSVTIAVSDCDKFEDLLNNSGASLGTVYLTSISEESGTWSGAHYLAHDKGGYTIIQPKWFEGPQKVKTIITLGEDTFTCNITLPREEAPEYTQEEIKGIRDYVIFGNEDSEQDNLYTDIRVNEGKTHNFEDHLLTYRTLQPRGSMLVNLKCDPNEQNYFTVKLWGNDTTSNADGMLWVTDPATNKIGVGSSRNSQQVVNIEPMRNGNVDRKQYVEIINLNSAPQYENGFIYSTYKIPMTLTKDKEYVSLRLYSTGNNSDYATVKIKEQTGNSRRIYAAFMTQCPEFIPEEFSDAGETVLRGTVTKGKSRSDITNEDDVQRLKNMVQNYAIQEIEIFKNRQVYTGDKYLPALKGLFTRNTSASTKATYKGFATGMNAQNMGPMGGLEAFAYAYTGDFYTTDKDKKAELFDRLICGFDYLTRAQGSNGGFYQKSDGVEQWIGGPDRLPAGGNNLTGFGVGYAGKAFLLMHEYNPDGIIDLFDEMIDSDADDNNEADQQRVLAYAAMFSKGRDYLESPSGAGHAPNQDMADITALLQFDQCLEIIDDYIENKAPELKNVTEKTFGEYSYPFAWNNKADKMTIYSGTVLEREVTGPERVKNSIDIALGRKPNISTFSYWVSPKGIVLENFGSINGGYTGDYGASAVSQVAEIVEMATQHYYPEDKEFYEALLNRAYDAISRFYFVENDGEGNDVLYAEGAVNERKVMIPGAAHYLIDEYSALKLEQGSIANTIALKIIQYYFEHGRIELEGDNLIKNNYAHFESKSVANIKLYYSMEELIQKIITNEDVLNYEFPSENDDDTVATAWADEMAQVVAIDVNGEKIYLNMNFRTWMSSTKKYVYNPTDRILPSCLTRFHRKNDRYENFGYADNRVHGWSHSNTSSGWNFSNGYIEAMFITEFNDDLTVLMNTTGCGLEYTGDGDPIDYTGEELNLDLKEGKYVDLISGEKYVFFEPGVKTLSIPASSTVVLMYEGSAEYSMGDTNNDEKITAVDALLALKYSLEDRDFESMTIEEKISYRAGLVTGGEKITIQDVLAILEAASLHTKL